MTLVGATGAGQEAESVVERVEHAVDSECRNRAAASSTASGMPSRPGADFRDGGMLDVVDHRTRRTGTRDEEIDRRSILAVDR